MAGTELDRRLSFEEALVVFEAEAFFVVSFVARFCRRPPFEAAVLPVADFMVPGLGGLLTTIVASSAIQTEMDQTYFLRYID